MKYGRKRRWKGARLVLAALLAALLAAPAAPAFADRTLVAVAANFTAAAQEIAEAFHADTGHEAVLSFGSTGTLYTQIVNGGPYDVFLAADDARPQLAIDAHLAVAGSRYTYAIGKLVLYSADPKRVDAAGAVLRQPTSFAKLAIANPQTAPYGAAAIEVLKSLQVYNAVQDRIVQGNSILQTYQFIATGNVEMGFVALSQLVGVDGGSRWVVPSTMYAPIRQDAVLLNTGAAKPAARAFVDFLHAPRGRAIIERYGYGLE